jgi:hypothetical protein
METQNFCQLELFAYRTGFICPNGFVDKLELISLIVPGTRAVYRQISLLKREAMRLLSLVGLFVSLLIGVAHAAPAPGVIEAAKRER